MKPHRFTLADDDADALFLLHKLIEKLYPHSSVATFSNAEDAFVHILETGTDFLITDHGMGTMSGTELIKALRDKKSDLPIIMISSNPMVRAEAEAAGANAFVERSLSTKTLEAEIERLLPE
jgi:DNA-binding NtrC family response regulator